MNKLKALTILLSLSFCTITYAASDGIRSSKTDECAIWVCLPGGFPASAECSAAQAAYIARLTDFTSGRHPVRRFSSLPNFNKNCNEDHGYHTVDGQIRNNNTVMSYAERQDAHVPAHRECVNIVPVYEHYSSDDGSSTLIGYRCAEWREVAETYVENSTCNFKTLSQYNDEGYHETRHGRVIQDELYLYSLDGEKLKSFSTPAWCDHTVTSTIEYADGLQVGNMYRQIHD